MEKRDISTKATKSFFLNNFKSFNLGMQKYNRFMLNK